MRHEHENARRHAYNTLAEVNRHLDRGNIKDPKHHQMLIDMAEKATRTMDNLDRLESRRPYSDTNIGYGTNVRRYTGTADDLDDMINVAMDAVERMLPHLDDMDDVDARRGRPRTTRRGVGRWTQVRRHVRRMPRGEMVDRYDDDRYDDDDDRYADDRYADDRYDVEDRRARRMPRRGRRGRFIRGDNDRYDHTDDRYDDRRMDDENRMKDDRYDNRRTDDDRTAPYSGPGPVMNR